MLLLAHISTTPEKRREYHSGRLNLSDTPAGSAKYANSPALFYPRIAGRRVEGL